MRTAVLLMTDVVGSTRLWSAEHDAMNLAMARHHEIVHGLVAARGGSRPVDQGEGDAVFAQFPSAVAAVACAADVHRALAAEGWPTTRPLSVRIAMHVGEVEERDGNLFGDPVNRCARLRGLAAGGQTLVSSALYEVVRDRLPADLELSDLGEHRLKDLSRPERVWQLSGDGLAGPFPPLPSLDRVRHNLPVQSSTFVGRDEALVDLVALVREHRLVTVTGFGGMGKTRLALQAAAELTDGSMGDVWFVDLAAVEDPSVVPARVAEVLSLRWGAGDPADALVSALGEAPALLVLDNLEQVLGCAAFVADLLARTPAVRVLATSREPLRVRGERQLPIPPLRVPSGAVSRESLSTYEAVRLFVDRALSVRPDFVVDNTTAPAVAALCARLDGHPLALELAAARLKVLSVDKLLARLDSALSVLTGGARDMPERHQTLRATIAWSFDAMPREEQLLLTRMSVFDGPATLEMVESVCGAGLDVLDLISSLVDKSLVRCGEIDGETRFSLLASIREYAAEQLDPIAFRGLQDSYAAHVTATLASFARNAAADYKRLHAWVGDELVHVRFTLEHLRTTGSEAYARVVVGLDDTFIHRGLAAEMTGLAETALAMSEAHEWDLSASTRALLLSTLLFARTPFYLSTAELAVQAIEAARASMDPAIHAESLSLVISDAARSEAHAKELLAELDAQIARMPNPSERVDERNNAASIMLQFVDPDGALVFAASVEMAGEVRTAEIFVDRGDWQRALDVIERTGAAVLTGRSNPMWESRILASRARALVNGGCLDEARAVAVAAQMLERTVGRPPLGSALALMGVAWRAGDPDVGVEVADDLLAQCLPEALDHVNIVAARWRRAVCLRELGRTDEAAAELAAARDILAASELYGPRELLGVLVARASKLASQEPARAAAICASVQAHRGDWVLPFAMDARLDDLLARLPVHEGAVPHPTKVW